MEKQFLRIISFIFFLHVCEIINAQYDETFAVQSVALGNQSAALSQSFNPVGNPSLMAENKKSTLGIAVINKFFITNLKQGALGITRRITKSDYIGMVIQFDGTINFKESFLVLSYAKRINEKFNCGLSFIYLNTFEQTIGSRNNFLGKAGISFKPAKSIMIGTTVFNPFISRFSSFSKDRIPTFIAAGICYKVSDQVKVYSEYKLGLNDVRNFKLGLSYSPKPEMAVFAGFQNSNSPLSFGFTFKTKGLDFQIAMQYHQTLGFSPACGFDYSKN